MVTNDAGLKLIESCEGCYTHAYKLAGEKYFTIGYGHSFDTSITADTVWTKKQCETQLKKDLKKYEKYVNEIALTKFPKLNENQYSALVSYTYNRGQGGLKQLIENSESKKEVGTNIVKYWGSAERYKNGLINRRKKEQKLYKTPVES